MCKSERGVSMRYILSLLVVLFIGKTASAASIYKHALDQKRQAYLSEGVFYGGIAQKPSSLLNIRTKYVATAKLERVVFDIGDQELKPLSDRLGAYHAAIHKGPK